MRNIEKSVCRASFGEFICSGRKNKQLTQSEVAAMLNVTQQFLSLVEKGERDVDLDFALSVCLVLDLDMRNFVVRFM